jgi:LDH2 family malate/lactate/ureidoglycolate dehydrogenase
VEDPSQKVSYDECLSTVTAIFVGHGLPGQDAARVAECLLEADLRGLASHGVSRIPIYTRRLRLKLVNPKPELKLTPLAPAAAHLDGDNGMGFVVASRGMAEAIERARACGIGMVLAMNSNHFGMAASYLLQALNADMAAIVLTNASPAMPIWGGRTPFLGTSPLAIAVPGGKVPLVLDMATSVAARGKIRRAAQQKGTIPAGWALDPQGRPTTDAQAAYDGVVLPLGGPKGSGLSLLMEALAGVMSGAAFGGGVKDQYKDFETPQNVGHTFIAMRPELFIRQEAYEARMDDLVARAKASPLAEGFDEILMPGEGEQRRAGRGRGEGLEFSAADIAMLREEAASVGAASLV